MDKLVIIVLSLFTLTACASPQGKLASSYKELPVQTSFVQEAPQIPLSVVVPQTNLYGAGLLGAVVSTVATEVSRQKRMPGIREIQSVMKPQEVFSLIGDSTLNTVKNADWINENSTLMLKNYPASDRKAVLNNHLLSMSAPTVTSVSSQVLMGEYFENLTQTSTVNIHKVDNGKKGSKIYSLILSAGYVPPNLEVSKDFTNYRVWTQNNAQEIRNGINQTTNNINQQLTEWLRSPHAVIDKTPKP
jgi:hypothetical protein